MTDILLWWALFSCVTFLCIVSITRHVDNIEVKDYDKQEWVTLSVVSILFPFGVWLILQEVVWPWLIKKRDG